MYLINMISEEPKTTQYYEVLLIPPLATFICHVFVSSGLCLKRTSGGHLRHLAKSTPQHVQILAFSMGGC